MEQKNIKKIFINIVPPIISALLVSGLVYAAWTEPGAEPPGDNAPAPINVGPDAQTFVGSKELNMGETNTGIFTIDGGILSKGIFETFTDTYLATVGGNVGIGTSDPGAKLDIAGWLGEPGHRIKLGQSHIGASLGPAGGYTRWYLGHNIYWGGGYNDGDWTITDTTWNSIFLNDNETLKYIVPPDGESSISHSDLQAHTKFSVTNSGKGYFADNVGIGTTNPYDYTGWGVADLDVNGIVRAGRFIDDDTNYYADLNTGANLGGTWTADDFCKRDGPCLSNVSGGQQQCITFINPVNVYTGGDSINWTVFDASAYVPEGATGVLLEGEMKMSGPDGGDWVSHIRIRRDDSSPSYILLRGGAAGHGDITAWAGQGIYPLAPDRTFQYIIEPPGSDWSSNGVIITLVGYTTACGVQPVDCSVTCPEVDCGTMCPRPLAYKVHNADVTYSATNSWTDVDSTNLSISFTAPSSGKVIVRLTGTAAHNGCGELWWSLREGGTNVSNSAALAIRSWCDSGDPDGETVRVLHSIVITGLTPGSNHTYKWGFKKTGSKGQILVGGDNGQAIMEVWSLP